jgi:hypothetical protein
MKNILLAGILALTLSACGGGDGGGSGGTTAGPDTSNALDTTVNAPALATIRAALGANNAYGIVPGLALGAIALPACTHDDGSAAEAGITYSVSGLPAWLSFDAASRTLALASGTTVPANAMIASEITYSCTSDTASAQTVAKETTAASLAFVVNDLDGGGVVDGYEHKFGSVPLVGNTGWFWLAPDSVPLYRSGTGPFRIPTGIIRTSVGMNPNDASDDTVDFDGDAIANDAEAANAANIFVVPSTGTFGAASTYPTGKGPGDIAAGDLDGDGDLDLAVANRETLTSTVSVLLGDGDGTFAPRADYAGSRPIGLGLADLDGDGDLDIATVDFGAATVSIFLNNGNGTFAAAVPYAKAEADGRLALGDFDGDGDVDIAATNGTYSPTSTLSVLLGKGDGTFAPKADYTVGDVPKGVTVADLDRDGDLDIIVANNQGASISVLLGKGDGTFAPKVDYDPGTEPIRIVAADFNADGMIDVAITSGLTDEVFVIPGNGDGTLAVDRKTSYAAANAPNGLVAADLDGDGDIDLAYAIDGGGMGNTIEVRFNDGSGAFGAASSSTVGTRPTSLTAGDFNGDGKLDLASSHFTPNDPAVLLNQ